jgi:hypothetical protein
LGGAIYGETGWGFTNIYSSYDFWGAILLEEADTTKYTAMQFVNPDSLSKFLSVPARNPFHPIKLQDFGHLLDRTQLEKVNNSWI